MSKLSSFSRTKLEAIWDPKKVFWFIQISCSKKVKLSIIFVFFNIFFPITFKWIQLLQEYLPADMFIFHFCWCQLTHSVHPHFCRVGASASNQIFKKGRAWQDLYIWRGLLGKRRVTFFRGGGCNFHIKKIKIWNI